MATRTASISCGWTPVRSDGARLRRTPPLITLRSITAHELGPWARLDGSAHDRLERSVQSLWDSGESRPAWCFIAEQDGHAVGRVGFAAGPAASSSPNLEFRTVGLWVGQDVQPPAIANALLRDALAGVLPPGRQTVDGRVNADTIDRIELLRELYQAAGYRLFQEKEGFLWTADDADPPRAPGRSARLTFRSVDEAGEDAFADVMSRGVVGTLDRNDTYYRELVGREQWGPEMLGYLQPEDRASWLIGRTASGEIAGYVLVGDFEPPDRGTIVHIGVVPEQRGHGYIDDLLTAAGPVARARGYNSMLSDVDVQNLPMLAAMERAGHSAAATPWHVWHYRLDARS